MFPVIYHLPATGRGINAAKNGIYRAGEGKGENELFHAIYDLLRQKGDFPFLSSWPNHWN
jgi:hypothetical protein